MSDEVLLLQVLSAPTDIDLVRQRIVRRHKKESDGIFSASARSSAVSSYSVFNADRYHISTTSRSTSSAVMNTRTVVSANINPLTGLAFDADTRLRSSCLALDDDEDDVESLSDAFQSVSTDESDGPGK